MNEPAIAPLATENRLARATRKMAKASEITAAPRMENSIPRLASNTTDAITAPVAEPIRFQLYKRAMRPPMGPSGRADAANGSVAPSAAVDGNMRNAAMKNCDKNSVPSAPSIDA